MPELRRVVEGIIPAGIELLLRTFAGAIPILTACQKASVAVIHLTRACGLTLLGLKLARSTWDCERLLASTLNIPNTVSEEEGEEEMEV